jgi:hypothetical protein
MTENQEIIARALEIAITLTKAESSWMVEDIEGNILIHEPLLSKMKTIMRMMNADTLNNIIDNAKKKTINVYANKP